MIDNGHESLSDYIEPRSESLGDLVRANLIYTKDGVQYRKIKRDEVIEEGAMQTWCHGELQPIKNSDGKTIGDTPSSFSDERDFYNPITKIIPNYRVKKEGYSITLIDVMAGVVGIIAIALFTKIVFY